MATSFKPGTEVDIMKDPKPEDVVADTIRCHYDGCDHPVTPDAEQITCPKCREALCMSTTSFKGEVEVQCEWVANALRFATESEAKSYAQDLYSRWTLCAGFRAEPSEDPVTHVWVDGEGLRSIEDEPGTERMPARRVQL